MKIIDCINEYFGTEVDDVNEFLNELDEEVDVKDNYKQLKGLLLFIERKEFNQ